MDERGWTYKFDFISGTYSLVKRLGSKGTTIVSSNKREEEFLIGLANKKVVCIDVEAPSNTSLVGTLTGHKHEIKVIGFHPSSTTAFTASVDSLIVWDTNNWQRVRTLSSGSGIVDALFTPTGDLLLVLFRNKTIVGWDTSSFDIKVG